MEDRKGRAWVATSASCMYEHTQGDMSGVTVWYCRYISNGSLDEFYTIWKNMKWFHEFKFFKVYAGGIQHDEWCTRFKKCKRADVLEFHPYESFDSVTFENDIALLLLDTFTPDSSAPDEDYITRIPIRPTDEPIPGSKYRWNGTWINRDFEIQRV